MRPVITSMKSIKATTDPSTTDTTAAKGETPRNLAACWAGPIVASCLLIE